MLKKSNRNSTTQPGRIENILVYCTWVVRSIVTPCERSACSKVTQDKWECLWEKSDKWKFTCHSASKCTDKTPRAATHCVLHTHGHGNTKRLVLVPLRVVVHERSNGIEHDAYYWGRKNWVSMLDEVHRLIKLGQDIRIKRRRRRRKIIMMGLMQGSHGVPASTVIIFHNCTHSMLHAFYTGLVWRWRLTHAPK